MSVALNTSSLQPLYYIILLDISAALENTNNSTMDRMQEQMVVTLLSTIFLGAYTLCVAYAIRTLTCRGPTGSRRKLIYVTVAMYLASLVSWIAFVVTQFQTFGALRSNLFQIYSWIPPADCFFQSQQHEFDLPGYCTTIPSEASQDLPEYWPETSSECVGTSALAFNVAVGDAIVWWRVWVLWNKNRPVLVLSCLVLFATLAFGAVDTTISCIGVTYAAFLGLENGATQAPTFGSSVALRTFGTVVIALSLFSNAAATFLVGYKAWKHRRDTKTHFASVPSVGRVQRVLMLLVESGIAYSLIWAVMLSSRVSGYTTFSYGIQYFSEGCLLALVGIYPTVIIILVALEKSEIEKQSHAWSLPVVRPSPTNPRFRLATTVTDTILSGDVAAGNGRPQGTQSIVLIGMPMSSSAQSVSDVGGTSLAEDETKCKDSGGEGAAHSASCRCGGRH